MWLTVIFPNLCVYVYILTHTPRMAPAHPLLMCAIACIMQGHDVGENRLCLTFHRHTEGIHSFKHLLVYDNCYAISCHHLWWNNRGSFHTKGVLQSRCSFTLPLHRRWSCHISTSRVPLCQWSIEVSNIGRYHIQSIWQICNTNGDLIQAWASHEFSALTS